MDLPSLFHAFDGGATLVVSQFHELHAPLMRFCRGLEQVFLHGVSQTIFHNECVLVKNMGRVCLSYRNTDARFS